MRIRSWDQVRIDRVCAAGVIIICAMTSFSICQSRSRIRALEEDLDRITQIASTIQASQEKPQRPTAEITQTSRTFVSVSLETAPVLLETVPTLFLSTNSTATEFGADSPPYQIRVRQDSLPPRSVILFDDSSISKLRRHLDYRRESGRPEDSSSFAPAAERYGTDLDFHIVVTRYDPKSSYKMTLDYETPDDAKPIDLALKETGLVNIEKQLAPGR